MNTTSITLPGGQVEITVAEFGAGQPFLFLHGGAGPQSVMGFAKKISEAKPVRALAPTHPGFGGTARPDWLHSPAQLADLYLALLDQLDLHQVIVVGSSLGGWVAAEMAVKGSDRIDSYVIMDAVGIEVEGHPILDILPMALDEVIQHSWHNPANFPRNPNPPTDDEKRILAGNRAALIVYGGASMINPALRDQLGQITAPTLVVWGESDGIADPGYGRAFAAAIPTAVFQVLPNAGHLPQLETPDQLLDAIWNFVETHTTVNPTS